MDECKPLVLGASGTGATVFKEPEEARPRTHAACHHINRVLIPRFSS